MKKFYFIPLFLTLIALFSGKSFAQFQGFIELKETTYGLSPSKQKSMSDMIPPEAKEEIKKQIEEKENELKNKSKSDEDYGDLANEIKMMKEQLGGFESSSEIKPKTEIIKMWFLNNDVRTENSSEDATDGVAIMKVKEKKMIVIMDKEKKYMEVDFAAIKQMTDAFKNFKTDESKKEETPDYKAKIKKTGKSMVILGYKCDEYIMEEEETISSVWICPNFTGFWKIFSELATSFEMDKKKGPSNWFSEVLGESGYPFKSIEKTKDGKILSEMEVTKVNKSKPDASLFAPPKGYTKMNMTDMFNPK